MLQLKGDAAPKSQHHSTSTTTELKSYQKSINGIEVQIIDTPGLAATDVSEAKIIAELQAESEGKADMLLYCISILPNSKIDEQDEKIMKTLKMAFGPDIWRHTILVLTFANCVIHDLEEGTTLSGLVNDYATTFQSKFKKICLSFSVVSIFSCNQDEVQRDPETIIALPAGRNPSKNLVEGTKWDESIYMEVLKKCNPEAIPALLNVRESTIIKILRQIAQLFKITGSAAFAEAFVGIVGGVTGTLIGAGLGALAGGVGMVPGAAAGADIGAGIGLALAGGGAGGLAAVATGVATYVEEQEHEEEETKLEEFQEALQQGKLKK